MNSYEGICRTAHFRRNAWSDRINLNSTRMLFMIVRRGIRDLPARRALVLLVGTEKKYYRKYQYEYREQREEKDIMERPAEHQLVIPEKMLAHKVRPGN